MRVAAVIQARMTSRRLPGKVMAPIGERPMLAHVIERVARARRVDGILVACTDNPTDAPIVEWCRSAGVEVARGDERDVLSRYVGAAGAARADVLVRITSDCPLLDAAVVDRVIEELLARRSQVDYAANVLRRTYPRGLDVEAMFLDALLRADRFATTPDQREHVTLAMRHDPDHRFRTWSVEADRDDSDLRWTVDTVGDLEYVRELHGRAGRSGPLPYQDLVHLCRSDPRLDHQDDTREGWR